jgi:hypothetical protein
MFVRVYLIAYFALLAGAVLALWQGGVLAEIPLAWTAIGLIVAVGLGVILAVTSARPPVRAE